MLNTAKIHGIGIKKFEEHILAGIFVKEKDKEPVFCIPSYSMLAHFFNLLIALRGEEEVMDKLKIDKSLVDIS